MIISQLIKLGKFNPFQSWNLITNKFDCLSIQVLASRKEQSIDIWLWVRISLSKKHLNLAMTDIVLAIIANKISKLINKQIHPTMSMHGQPLLITKNLLNAA